MKGFISVLRRFVGPYKKHLVLNFLYNLLSALLSVFSVTMMVPILNILFGLQKDVTVCMEWSANADVIKNNLYYFISFIKNEYSAGLALLFIGSFVIVGTLFKVGFAYLASCESIVVRNSVVRDLRQVIYNKLLALPIPFFSDERKGDIISRATGDVQEVETSIMSSLDMFLKNPVLILVYLITMLVMSFKMTLFVFIMLPIAGLIIGRVGKSLKKKSFEGQNKMGDLLGLIEESLGGLRIIKAFTAEKKMQNRFEKETESYRSIMNRLMRRRSLAHPMSEFLGTIVIVVIIWYGGGLILSNESTLSGAIFIAYIAIFYQIINPAKAFSTALYSIQKGLAAMDRIDKILLAENKITDIEIPVEVDRLVNHVKYDNVTFAYEEKEVLRNVSLEIEKGKTVALVGQSGSGKSTFVDLLPRFYDVKSGAIQIDGVDIRNIKIHDLRNLMGNVNQEAILFNDTIINNIAFGVEDASLEDVIKAAKIANAHEFILETELGYDTVIGDRGGKLSGGQRQRLSIARAILKNPSILILDEATSALDTESERLVQDALDKLMANRTSIVIAHRLSTIRNADLICVFHDGEIVEKGTHEELVELNGTYTKLHKLQVQ